MEYRKIYFFLKTDLILGKSDFFMKIDRTYQNTLKKSNKNIGWDQNFSFQNFHCL